jgi:hypothetical protein
VVTAYFYLLPQELGLDRKLNPVTGLSKSIGVLTISPRQSVRLLAKTPLQVDSKPLANVDRPLAAASALDFAALLDAIRPWMDYGVQLALARESAAATNRIDNGDPEEPRKQEVAGDGSEIEKFGPDVRSVVPDADTVKIVMDQVYPVMDILKCFRDSSSSTYFDGDVKVTHFAWHFRDLEP